MCIAFWTTDPLLIPNYRLDEFYKRPTLSAHWWPFEQCDGGCDDKAHQSSISASINTSDTVHTTTQINTTATSNIANNKDKRRILAGKDQQAGGTWLGVSGLDTAATIDKHASTDANRIQLAAGRLALLTNFREPPAQTHTTTDNNTAAAADHPIHRKPPSRGALVTDYLTAETSDVDAFTRGRSFHDHEGFNLLTMDLHASPIDAHVISNRSALGIKTPCSQQGVHAMSNGAYMDTVLTMDDINVSHTAWPKVQRGIQLFRDCLSAYRQSQDDVVLVEELMMMMQDTQRPENDNLLPKTGIPLAVERLLSAIFIQSPEYGTRTTTLLLLDHRNTLRLIEHNHLTQTRQQLTTELQ